jgi:methyl coenzyme M reductase subunit D
MAAAAASVLGMHAVKSTAVHVEDQRRMVMLEEEQERLRADAEKVEINTATEAALTDVVTERQELYFAGDGMELRVKRDIRGKVTVTAHGHGMSRAEVEAFAHRYLGLLRQQAAYRQAVTALKRHGFGVAEEDRAKDGTVKVRIRRRRS